MEKRIPPLRCGMTAKVRVSWRVRAGVGSPLRLWWVRLGLRGGRGTRFR